MEDFQIEFYRTEHGNCPVEDFLNQLNDGIFELRISQGSNISRILYFYASGRTVVLTNGFIKKSAKTPAKEIEKAKRSRKNYAERKTAHG